MSNDKQTEQNNSDFSLNSEINTLNSQIKNSSLSNKATLLEGTITERKEDKKNE